MRLLTLIFLLFTVSLSAAKYIQVPAIVSNETMSLRLQQLHRAGSVYQRFGQLKRIFKKEVYRIIDGNQTAFPTCYEEMPFATLTASSQLFVGTGANTYGLVYDFDKVKNRRNLIDIEMGDKCIFYAREDGYLRYVTVTSGSLKLSLMKQFKTKENKISKGNIVILPNATNSSTVGYGIFINHNQAVSFDLQGNNFIQLEGFLQMKDFQSAVAIQDGYIAVAYGEQGVVIYSIDLGKNKLKVEATFDKSNLDLKSPNFKDLAYDHSRKLLFMLDHNSGVISLQLIIGGGILKAQVTSSVIKNSYCNLIYYDGFTEELYLNCRELIKYHINNWPILDEKVLPRQDIAIRSMSSSGGSVVLAGRNVLQIIAQERKVAVYQDKLLQKFILRDSTFLSANQNYLMIGRYQIIPPQISCQSSDSSLVGSHTLVFKITAECNLDYFKSIGFEPGPVLPDDKCVYSVYQTVSFWQGKQVNVKVFLIVLGVIGALGLILLIWWGLSLLKLKKLRNNVERYQTLEQQQMDKTDSKKNPIQAEISPASASSHKEKGSLKQKEAQVGQELHDIE